MAVSLDAVNRVTLRTYKGFFEEQLRDLGVPLPTPWNPTDEELERLAETWGRAYREVYGAGGGEEGS